MSVFRRIFRRSNGVFVSPVCTPRAQKGRFLVLRHAEFSALTSQFAILKPGRGQHRKYAPFAFTEHGALQAANVLNSPKACTMSIYVIRAFVRMREELGANQTIAKRLAEIDNTLLTHDAALRDLYQKIRPLLLPPQDPPRRKIGFKTDS